MSILFFILKIIGILILIPIVLLLILLIFPICYQMEGDFDDKTPKAQAKVSWAVVFLRAKVFYEEELNFAIRIFGIPVYDSRKDHWSVLGEHPEKDKKKNKKKASTEATTKKEKKETKYDKLFKDKKVTTAKGFITLHKLDNKIYFELPIKVMNRDILLGSTIVETTDNQFGCVGEKSGDPFLIRFVQRDSTITLRRVQAGQFSEDREIKKRLVSSTMPAIAETFEIKAYNNDSTAVVFDMTDYLLSDKKNLSPFSPYSMMEMMGADISKDFEKESSFVQGVKGFEDNVSIRSLLTYKISVGMKGNYAVKKMPFTAVMKIRFWMSD